MRSAHTIAITTAAVAFPLFLATPANALQVPEPMTPNVAASESERPLPPGFMGRPGWVTP